MDPKFKTCNNFQDVSSRCCRSLCEKRYHIPYHTIPPSSTVRWSYCTVYQIRLIDTATIRTMIHHMSSMLLLLLLCVYSCLLAGSLFLLGAVGHAYCYVTTCTQVCTRERYGTTTSLRQVYSIQYTVYSITHTLTFVGVVLITSSYIRYGADENEWMNERLIEQWLNAVRYDDRKSHCFFFKITVQQQGNLQRDPALLTRSFSWHTFQACLSRVSGFITLLP